MIDLKGLVFGKLTVRDYYGLNKYKSATWLCQCACGKTTVVDGQKLRQNTTRSCGCLRHDSEKYGHPQSEETKKKLKSISVKQFKLRPFESAYNTLLLNAKRRSLEVDLTYSQYLGLTKAEKCTYCGSPIVWAEYNVRKHQGSNLDRKDNSKGYLFSNVVVCCWPCNNIKSKHFTYEQFLEIGKLLCAWNFPGSTKNLPSYLGCPYCPSQSYLQAGSAPTLALYQCALRHRFWVPKEAEC